jgi:hypothetical protein
MKQAPVMSTVAAVNKSQMKQAPVAVTIAAERHPVAELADHRSQETKSALRLAKGCARNIILLRK